MTERFARPHVVRLAIALSIAFGVSLSATTPVFTPTGSMHVARAGHQATLLLDGRVLVTGGYDKVGAAVPDAELFSPASGTWSAIPGGAIARMDHVATRLGDGRVLVVGGAPSLASCSPNATAEVYDPTMKTWSMTGDLPIAGGTGMIAVLLRDGRVLASGGNHCGQISKTAALFDPSTNIWSTAAPMNVPRAFHSAVLVTDSRVLVAGGSTGDGAFATTAEIYNPLTATWIEKNGPGTPRGVSCGGYMQTFLSVLQSGSVLATGGVFGDCATGASPSVTSDLFDPTNSRWSPAGKLEVARGLSTATLLPDGRVLIVGGYATSGTQSSTEFFDPAVGGWGLLGALQTARAGHTATRLANGTVLIAGGSNAEGRTDTAEVYVPLISYTAAPFLFPRTPINFNGRAWAMAMNSKAHVLIAFAPDSDSRISEWNSYGSPELVAPNGISEKTKYVREIGSELDWSHSVRIDKDDNIWAVGQSANTVTKLDPDGRVLLQFGRRSPPANEWEKTPAAPADQAPLQYLAGPTDVAWDSVGNIFVSDGDHARIAKFDAAGHFIASTGKLGSSPGEMRAPHSIASDAKGRVYVADGGNGRIQVFDNNLHLLTIYDAIGSPWSICITPGPHQFLYSSTNPDKTDMTRGTVGGEVYKLELDGTIVGKFGRLDNAFGSFGTPHSIDCRRPNELLFIGFGGWGGVIKLQP